MCESHFATFETTFVTHFLIGETSGRTLRVGVSKSRKVSQGQEKREGGVGTVGAIKVSKLDSLRRHDPCGEWRRGGEGRISDGTRTRYRELLEED